ncbi:MAG: twin-arginine translocation pathway signal protein [Pseudomonadota bacterium]
MSDKERSSRRDFLKLAATGAPVAAVAAVSGATGAEAAVEERAGEGLRVTEHTKKYYESARF